MKQQFSSFSSGASEEEEAAEEEEREDPSQQQLQLQHSSSSYHNYSNAADVDTPSDKAKGANADAGARADADADAEREGTSRLPQLSLGQQATAATAGGREESVSSNVRLSGPEASNSLTSSSSSSSASPTRTTRTLLQTDEETIEKIVDRQMRKFLDDMRSHPQSRNYLPIQIGGGWNDTNNNMISHDDSLSRNKLGRRGSGSSGENEDGIPKEHATFLYRRTVSFPEDPGPATHGSNVAVDSSYMEGNNTSLASPRGGIMRGDRKAAKRGTLEEASAIMQVRSDSANGVPGFDPSMWVVAAGLLEKRRDGRMREGWAKRWFVLDGETLYYFLLPRKDWQGICSLLGEERGQIKMEDVVSVREVPGNNHKNEGNYNNIIELEIAQMRKANPLSAQSQKLSLRAVSREATKKWLEALERTRIDAKRAAPSTDSSRSPQLRSGKSLATAYSSSDQNQQQLQLQQQQQQQQQQQRSSSSFINSPVPEGRSINRAVHAQVPEQIQIQSLQGSSGQASGSSRTLSSRPVDQLKKRSSSRGSIVPAPPRTVHVSAQDLEKLLAPKLVPTQHVNFPLSGIVFAAVNLLFIGASSVGSSTLWVMVNLIVAAGLLEIERRAMAHDSVKSNAQRSIRTLVVELEHTGLTPSGTLARQASSASLLVTPAAHTRPLGLSRMVSDESEGSLAPVTGHFSRTPGEGKGEDEGEGESESESEGKGKGKREDKASPAAAAALEDDENNLDKGASNAQSGKAISSLAPLGADEVESDEVLPTGWTPGSTMQNIGHDDVDDPDHMMSFFNSMGPHFKVRIGPNYKSNGKKAPSGDSMYELVGMDVIRHREQRITNLGSKINVPPPRDVDDLEAIRKCGLPRIFIVNGQIPEKAPSLWGGQTSNNDDIGCSVIFYFAIKPETVQCALNPEHSQAKPAHKLLKRFVQEWDTNPDIRRRFKAIGMITNLDDLQLAGGGFIKAFNGKPVIINKVGEIHKDPKKDWFEIDISVHQFPYAAKRGLHSFRDRTPDTHLRCGFVIQGESDEELPETILGGAEIRGMDFDKALDVTDVLQN